MHTIRVAFISFVLIFISLIITSGELLQAQQRPLLSPRDSTILYLEGKRLVVDYGRPSMRGRKIMGELVPWNKVWRTGANEATTFRTDTSLIIGPNIPLPKGAYTLWTLPSEKGWKLLVNKQTGQWGTNYDESQDFARFDLKVEKLDQPVEQFTITLEETSKSSGVLKMVWENTILSTSFMINEKRIPPSPRDSLEISIGGKKLSVNYGRPFMRGRRIIGNVVPYDSVWRTGANAATAFTTESDLEMSGVTIPKGKYSLWTLPSEKGWKLIVNKTWIPGAPRYDEKEDLARIDMKLEPLRNPVEQFTISLDRTGENSGNLKLIWEYTQASVGFKLK